MTERVSNAEQSQKTRQLLIETARHLFGKKGFGATGTEEVVAAAGVTRGALYHQFRDKLALFDAVVEEVERSLAAELTERVAGQSDPVEMLRTSAMTFLEICQRGEVRRIALLDAPSVLGWARWREIDSRYGLGLLRGLLGLAAERGLIDPAAIDSLAHLFLGAVVEAALAIAHNPDDRELEQQLHHSIDLLMERMLSEPA